MGAQKLDIVQCLLRYRPDVDAHDDRDDTALHTAARTGNFDIVMVSESQVKTKLVLKPGKPRTCIGAGFLDGLQSVADLYNGRGGDHRVPTLPP